MLCDASMLGALTFGCQGESAWQDMVSTIVCGFYFPEVFLLLVGAAHESAELLPLGTLSR